MHESRRSLHDQSIDADNLGFATDYLISDKIFARRIRFNDGMNKVLRDVTIIRQ